MKNDKTFEWLKETFEKGKLEVSKLTRISKIRIEIASLTKKKDERLKLLGKKVVALLDEGELVEEELMGEYETIKEIDAKIDELNELVEEIKAKKYEVKKEEVEDLEEDIEYETEIEERVEEEKGQIEESQISEEESKEFEETEEEKKKKVNKDNE
ncbi:hypothetical protein FHQ18_08665 [Deferribacter autotrophicus]|uniref:Uncharacterized protein n=1 Tax=Deferribacter autotrophicus TaxID=500465 RepID=A0A5A8F709_9BACT|nr:hypothetical protein [Deferribacter autotrophicus]KAA0257805.1 hypothetical protein FHQ18_08665 [Deferribacter autotrophicus]